MFGTRKHKTYYQMHANQLDFINYVTKKLIHVRTEAPQKDLRPLNKGIRRDESDSFRFILVWTLFGKLFLKKRQKIDHPKLNPKYLDSPRRWFRICCSPFVFFEIICVCVCTAGPRQL